MSGIVNVKDLWLRYRGGDWVLKGISFSISAGDIVLIVGRSGCGKSSFARALTGVAQRIFKAEVRGEIDLCFKKIESMDLDELQKCIQIVNQDPFTHFLDPIPIDDMISYAEKLYGDSGLEHVKLVTRIVGVEEILDKPITELSGGQIKRLSIAKALIPNPRVLILDEPLMWLDDASGTEMILNVIRMLRDMGKAVIVFEHRFKHLINIIDKMYVLKKGVLEEVNTSVIKYYKEYPSNWSPNSVEDPNGDRPSEHRLSKCETVLELRNIWHRYDRSKWILKGVDMNICRGDTIVIYGPNGSGKSTLLRILAGTVKPTRGYVKRYAEIVYVPQIPHLFITEDSVEEEVVAICKSKKLGRNCINSGIDFLKSFGYTDPSAFPLNMSWGQITRLSTLLAYIASRGGIILLDEPFTGSTYLEAYQLIDTVSRLRSSTKIITLSSKDYIPLFKEAKRYRIDDGVLKPFAYDDTALNIFLDLAKKLYS